jgi:hypothetical protein
MESVIGHLKFSLPFCFNRRSDLMHGIEIRGGAAFRRRTREALALLRPLPEFSLIRAHLAVIRHGKRSGMRAWAARPTFMVGAPTWKHSALWYAGAIAHDAYHAKLYRDAKIACPTAEPRADEWTGAAAERTCLAFQRRVLAALDADATILRYIENCAKNPTYQGSNKGWRGWLDYHRRWW